MVVGVWFDAEDLYGPLETYKGIEKQANDILDGIILKIIITSHIVFGKYFKNSFTTITTEIFFMTFYNQRVTQASTMVTRFFLHNYLLHAHYKDVLSF